MTRLEELIYSLTAIIIRYHDIQPKVKKIVEDVEEYNLREKSLIYAKNIIHNKEFPFDKQLELLVKSCSDSGRSHFLTYIIHEISFLKTFYDHSSTFESQQLEHYKNQIFQLFSNLKQLLDIPKNKIFRVTYSRFDNTDESSIALAGLKNDGYLGGELCNSGELVCICVLKPFNINLHSTHDAIKEIAEQICLEHQNALLVPQLQSQIAFLKQTNLEQGQNLDSLSTQYKEKQKKSDDTVSKQVLFFQILYFLFKRQKANEEKNKKIMEQQKETINKLNQEISDGKKIVTPKESNYNFFSY